MESYRAEAWDILQRLFRVKKFNNRVLHFAAGFSSELDLARLKQSADLLARDFPLVRCGFDDTRGRPFWSDRERAPGGMVRLTEADDPSEAARQFLCREEIDLAQGPQMKIGVIRGNGRDILCVLVNHMLCDAAGFKELLGRLASLYTALENHGEIVPVPLAADRSLRQIVRKLPPRNRLRLFFAKGNPNAHGKQAFRFEGDLSNPFIEVRKIPNVELSRYKDFAGRHGASLNDVFLAALLRVLARTFGEAPALPCAIDLRRFLPQRRAGGVCNLVTNLCCDIGPETGAAFADTLSKVKKVMDALKTDESCLKSIALLEAVYSACPYRFTENLLEKHFSNAPIAFTNIGVLEKNRLVFGSARMTGAVMTGSVKYSPYFQLAVSTFGGEAYFSVNLYGTQADRRKICAILDSFTEELRGGAV